MQRTRDDAFRYDPARDVYRCPAGQILKPRRIHPIRRTLEYKASAKICGRCALRAQCTRSAHGRTVQRHEKQEALNKARAQARSQAARRDRKRRQHLMEKSFADATNNHHFKRARWRRLWRQKIQDYLIAAIQNVRILLAHQNPRRSAAMAAAALAAFNRRVFALNLLHGLTAREPGANEPLEHSSSLTNALLLTFLQIPRFNSFWATRPLDTAPDF
jgi:hypothetical protein